MLSQFKESKVVVVGGSYSGKLVPWLKLLYPEMVDAVIASSTPVLAKKEFYESLETFSDDFEKHETPGCHDTIKKKFKRYDELFQTGAGIIQLTEEEQICKTINMSITKNKQVFFWYKIVSYINEVQYTTSDNIKKFCFEIRNSSRVYLKQENFELWSENDDCINYDFNDMIEGIKNDPTVMAWTYQTCTEFGYFESTSSKYQSLTNNVPIELFTSTCTKLYGAKFNEDSIDKSIKSTNALYEGLMPNNIVFVNGDIDPWSRLRVKHNISYKSPVKLIHGTSHCRLLLPEDSNDSEELKETRKYVKHLIKKWIGQ